MSIIGFIKGLFGGDSNLDYSWELNVFVKPNDQSRTCLSFGMARKRAYI